MNKLLILLTFVLLLSPLVVAEESFTFKYDSNSTLEIPMGEVTLAPCTTCTCTVTLNYPNGTIFARNVPGNNVDGYCQYIFRPGALHTQGYDMSFTDGADYGRVTGEYEVTLSGVPRSTTLIVADIFLILIISLIIFILHYNYKNKSYKESDNGIAEGHDGNWGKTFIKTLGNNFMRNSFLWYYSLGWVLLIVLKDLVYNFNTLEVYTYFVFMLNIYSFGFFLVIVVWISFFIDHFKFITDLIDDLNLGVDKE